MIDFEMLVDEIRIKARAAILDGCNLDLEPSQFSDCMEYLIDRLRQAEKDAARYRWLRDCNWNLSVACVVVDPKKSVKLGCDCPSGCRLDELVDAYL